MPQFQKGHRKLGGRKKGTPNRRTVELNLLTRMAPFMDGPGYARDLQRRISRGKAPHMESYLAQRLHGRPPDSLKLTGPNQKPLQITIRVVHDVPSAG